MKSRIKTLYILYGGLLMACATMWLVALSGLNSEKSMLEPQIISTLVPGVTLTFLAASFIISMILGGQIQAEMSPEIKYRKIMSTLMLRWAMIESSIVFNGIMYYVQPNQYSMIFAGLGLGVYFLAIPSRTMIIELGKLSVTEEREWFD